jgi:hypothetical protein
LIGTRAQMQAKAARHRHLAPRRASICRRSSRRGARLEVDQRGVIISSKVPQLIVKKLNAALVEAPAFDAAQRSRAMARRRRCRQFTSISPRDREVEEIVKQPICRCRSGGLIFIVNGDEEA